MDRSGDDYFTRLLPQQHQQHHRRYGNVPVAVGRYPWYISGVDVTDNYNIADHSSDQGLLTARN